MSAWCNKVALCCITFLSFPRRLVITTGLQLHRQIAPRYSPMFQECWHRVKLDEIWSFFLGKVLGSGKGAHSSRSCTTIRLTSETGCFMMTLCLLFWKDHWDMKTQATSNCNHEKIWKHWQRITDWRFLSKRFRKINVINPKENDLLGMGSPFPMRVFFCFESFFFFLQKQKRTEC